MSLHHKPSFDSIGRGWEVYWMKSELMGFLSVSLQAAIRKELNEFKSSEMEVHEESKQFTR